MVTATISRVAPFCFALVLTQCTSLDRAVTLTPEDEVVVELTQPRAKSVTEERRLSLITETVVDKSEFYNSRKTDQHTKVVPATSMQLLLDALATGGYFQQAGERRLTTGNPAIRVSINGEERVWERSVAQWATLDNDGTIAADRARRFTLCSTAFLDLYNATKAYRTGVGLNRVMQEHQEQMAGRKGTRGRK